MNAQLDLTQVSFHDVGLLGIVHTGSTVTFTLEDVLVFGTLKVVEVTIDGVSAVVRNGFPASDLQMERQDGELLTLRKEGGQILVAIQWDDFTAHTHEVVAYILTGPTITLRAKVAM